METCSENENSNKTTSELEYLRCSTDDELTFTDWHFVDPSDEQESDDDSIEVITREVLASSPSLPSTDSEESDNEERFKDVVNETEGIGLTTDHIRTIVPLDSCHSCALSVRKMDKKVDATNGVTWKGLYSFVLGVLASLIFHHYKSCIPEKFSSFPYVGKLNTVDMYSSYFPFARTNIFAEEYTSPIPSDVRNDYDDDDDDSTLKDMRDGIERQRTILNDIFMKHLDILKHVRRVKNDVYVFRIHKFAELYREDDLIRNLKLGERASLCEDNITSERLPLVCLGNDVYSVFVKQSQIHLIAETVRKMYAFNEKRANHVYKSTLNSLTGSTVHLEDDVGDEYSHDFAPDCDHFSKRYKTSAYCTRKNAHCAGEKNPEMRKSKDEIKLWKTPCTGKAKSNDHRIRSRYEEIRNLEDPDIVHTPYVDVEDDQESIVYEDESSPKMRRNDEGVSFRSRAHCPQFKSEYMNEMAPKREAQAMFAANEKKWTRCSGERRRSEYDRSHYMTDKMALKKEVETVTTEDEQKWTTEEDKSSNVVDEEGDKVISGEWLFDLHAARAKLRAYYDQVVAGDWILKLGRAREKLRRSENKDRYNNANSGKYSREKKDYGYWYKRTAEKFNRKCKTYIAQAKQQLKAMKERIANTFKEIKSNFKNRFRK